jgi:hypothetical protein
MGDWGDSGYLFSQIMALCGCACVVLSFLQKRRVFILIWVGFSAVFYSVSYIYLGGIFAAISELIVIPRNTAMFFVDNKRTNENRKKVLKADWIMLVVSVTAVIVSGIIAWDNSWCILILVSGIFYDVAICQKDIGIYCNLCLCGLLGYLIYDFYLQSVVSIVFDSIVLVGNIFGIIRYYKKRKVPRLIRGTIPLCK